MCRKAHIIPEGNIIGKANIICQRQTSFKKVTFVYQDKSDFFVWRPRRGIICFASALLAHPSLRLRYRSAHLFAKNMPPACFLHAKTLSGFEPLLSYCKQKRHLTVSFLFGDREGARTLDLQRDRLAF